MGKPKEMELSMQSSYADGRWNVTLQAWIGTKAAAQALIDTITISRDILPDSLPTDEPAVTNGDRKMIDQWEANGPDDFGDFNIRTKGEELAKCVVVQNGFRTPQETKQMAEHLIAAINNHVPMIKALGQCAQLFDTLAQTMDRWAVESRDGGWSTHQVADNRKRANDCRHYAELIRAAVPAPVGTVSGSGL